VTMPSNSAEHTLTALVRQDDDQWTALCLELDIAAHGNSPDEAFHALQDLVHQYVTHMRATGRRRFSEMLRPVPPDALAEFLAGGEPPSSSLVQREVSTARFAYA